MCFSLESKKKLLYGPALQQTPLTTLKSNYTACLIRGTRSEEETVAGVQFSNVPSLTGAHWTALLLSAAVIYSVISELVSS